MFVSKLDVSTVAHVIMFVFVFSTLFLILSLFGYFSKTNSAEYSKVHENILGVSGIVTFVTLLIGLATFCNIAPYETKIALEKPNSMARNQYELFITTSNKNVLVTKDSEILDADTNKIYITKTTVYNHYKYPKSINYEITIKE